MPYSWQMYLKNNERPEVFICRKTFFNIMFCYKIDEIGWDLLTDFHGRWSMPWVNK